jgi:hypothetical protein
MYMHNNHCHWVTAHLQLNLLLLLLLLLLHTYDHGLPIITSCICYKFLLLYNRTNPYIQKDPVSNHVLEVCYNNTAFLSHFLEPHTTNVFSAPSLLHHLLSVLSSYAIPNLS